jgi:hypothetical protein
VYFSGYVVGLQSLQISLSTENTEFVDKLNNYVISEKYSYLQKCIIVACIMKVKWYLDLSEQTKIFDCFSVTWVYLEVDIMWLMQKIPTINGIATMTAPVR